jgi:hypothetical protein
MDLFVDQHDDHYVTKLRQRNLISNVFQRTCFGDYFAPISDFDANILTNHQAVFMTNSTERHLRRIPVRVLALTSLHFLKAWVQRPPASKPPGKYFPPPRGDFETTRNLAGAFGTPELQSDMTILLFFTTLWQRNASRALLGGLNLLNQAKVLHWMSSFASDFNPSFSVIFLRHNILEVWMLLPFYIPRFQMWNLS